jgi:hypothetical protein
MAMLSLLSIVVVPLAISWWDDSWALVPGNAEAS